MQTIKDNEGRPWIISVTAATGLRIRDAVRLPSTSPAQTTADKGEEAAAGEPFDILNVAQVATTLNVLRGMPLVLAETAWAVVQPQAVTKGVSRESFLESMSGDALDAIGKAIIDAIIEFFPASQRRMVAVLREKLDEVSDALIGAAEKELASIETADVVTAASGHRDEARTNEVAA